MSPCDRKKFCEEGTLSEHLVTIGLALGFVFILVYLVTGGFMYGI